MYSPKSQRGVSIAELMVSIAIGLVVTLAISTLFLNTHRSNKENNDITMMQENARFAMESIAEDLRHSGFFGNVSSPGDINSNGVTMPNGTDCNGSATPYMLDFTNGQKMIDYSPDLTDSQVTSILAPCTITGTLPSSGNSLLIIKRVSTNRMFYGSATLQAGGIYVHSTGSSSALGVGTATPLPDPATQIWQYTPRFYYITNTGTLYRSTFGGTISNAWVNEPLAEGIEQFRVEFGIDSDNPTDGTPNYFTDTATDATFNNIVSARVYILARTTTVDNNYTDTSTYNLGSYSYGTTANPIPANLTHYHREVYSTTVTIPNMRQRLLP